MRPVYRGSCPIVGDYNNYKQATDKLIERIGDYCSYCERPVKRGNIEVEHIQSKDHYIHLIGRWDNYLFACKNCNSTKRTKDILLSNQYIPDRDNTFIAFKYTEDGRVKPADHLTAQQIQIAKETLALTGIDRDYNELYDDNDVLVVIDRQSSRTTTWGIAKLSSDRLSKRPSIEMREQIAETARAQGHFSIWMKVFEDDIDMRKRFINIFKGTSQDCFDDETKPISPRASNGLLDAGKI